MSRKSYVLAGIVAGLSFAAAWFLPVSEFFKGLASLPFVAGLATVLWQLWRDALSHERQLALQRREQEFALGVAALGACDPRAAWRNHGEFVRCVTADCEELVAAEVLTDAECDVLVGQAGTSDVGK